jgi:glycosyltransferase involved in cell wall biosynthesis
MIVTDQSLPPPDACHLSVVLPCANERDNLPPLLEELEPALQALGCPFEVICVDDGSTDGGWDVLRGLQAGRPWLRLFRHRTNFGQSASYCTGFRLARGELVLTMDADRQHDPADIRRFLGELRGDLAAVCGVRAGRHDNWVRRRSSQIANGFNTWVTGDRVVDAGCTFRLIRKSALAELPVFNGQHRFLPTLLRLQGHQVLEIPVNHRQRPAGKSKYGIGNRLWRGILDCLAIRWYRQRAFPADRLAPGQPGPSAAAPATGATPAVTGELKR